MAGGLAGFLVRSLRVSAIIRFMLNKNSPQEVSEREFAFTQQDFQRVKKLIHEHAGISLSDSKLEMVYSRLSKRVRATGAKDFNEYLNKLERLGGAEWESFANALTTNLTAFFREAHHFPILAEHVRKHPTQERITIWCAAASTGEEAYSIAMTLADVFNSLRPPVSIIASDLDTKVLETAKAGIYPAQRVEKLDAELVKRYFQPHLGGEPGDMRVRQELRDLISFRRVNLLDTNWPIRPPLDAIFCRNVMIYFDKPTQLAILKKFVPLLKPEGLLFAGHSESFYHAADLFKLLGKTVYELAPQAKSNSAQDRIGR